MGLTHAEQQRCGNACRWRAAASVVAVIAVGLVLASCQAAPVGPTFSQGDLSCVDDSARCISARKRGLRALMADGDRAWQRNKPTARNYAAGVRMFAYSKQRTTLSCAELKRGAAEAKAAGRTLRGPGGRGLTPAQISRGAMLGTEVARTLDREHRRRC